MLHTNTRTQCLFPLHLCIYTKEANSQTICVNHFTHATKSRIQKYAWKQLHNTCSAWWCLVATTSIQTIVAFMSRASLLVNRCDMEVFERTFINLHLCVWKSEVDRRTNNGLFECFEGSALVVIFEMSLLKWFIFPWPYRTFAWHIVRFLLVKLAQCYRNQHSTACAFEASECNTQFCIRQQHIWNLLLLEVIESFEAVAVFVVVVVERAMTIVIAFQFYIKSMNVRLYHIWKEWIRNFV